MKKSLFESIQDNLNEYYDEYGSVYTPEFYTDEELDTFWEDRIYDDPKDVQIFEIESILDDASDYLAHESRSAGIEDIDAEFFRILPIIIKNGIDFGIDKKKLNKAASIIKSKIEKYHRY